MTENLVGTNSKLFFNVKFSSKKRSDIFEENTDCVQHSCATAVSEV